MEKIKQITDLLTMKTTIEILISLLLAYVAYQNYKINGATFRIEKNKFRLDLFKRRHNIFKSLQKFLINTMQNGTPTHEALDEFKTQTSDAEFLFGKDIKDYVEDLSNKSLRAIQLNRRLVSSTTNTTNQLKIIAKELYELETWFGDQYKNSRLLFKKYLYFSISKNY